MFTPIYRVISIRLRNCTMILKFTMCADHVIEAIMCLLTKKRKTNLRTAINKPGILSGTVFSF